MMGQRETPGNRFNQPIPLGTNVFDVNGEKVGTVSGYHAQGEYLTIQKGWLLTHDIYVPFTRIGNVIASEVHLSLTKDELKEQRWATPPVSMPGSNAVGMDATRAPLVAEQGRVEPERVRTEDTRAQQQPETKTSAFRSARKSSLRESRQQKRNTSICTSRW